MKRHVSRGYLQVTAGFAASRAEDLPSLNNALLDSYLAAFRAAKQKHGLTGEPDLNIALRIPGMFAETAGEHDDELVASDAEAALTEALQALNAFREREGREIAAVLGQRTASLRATAGELETIRDSVPEKNGMPAHDLIVHIYCVTAWVGTPANRQPEEHSTVEWFSYLEAIHLDLAHPAYPRLFAECLPSNIDNRS